MDRRTEFPSRARGGQCLVAVTRFNYLSIIDRLGPLGISALEIFQRGEGYSQIRQVVRTVDLGSGTGTEGRHVSFVMVCKWFLNVFNPYRCHGVRVPASAHLLCEKSSETELFFCLFYNQSTTQSSSVAVLLPKNAILTTDNWRRRKWLSINNNISTILLIVIRLNSESIQPHRGARLLARAAVGEKQTELRKVNFLHAQRDMCVRNRAVLFTISGKRLFLRALASSLPNGRGPYVLYQ